LTVRDFIPLGAYDELIHEPQTQPLVVETLADKQSEQNISLQHEKESLVEKVTMVWTCFLTLIYMINFNFWINFNCLLRQRLTMNN